MTKKKLRRRIAELERELTLGAFPPSYVTAAVFLGPTGGGVNVIDWPILIGKPSKPLDLPALGYVVRKREPDA